MNDFIYWDEMWNTMNNLKFINITPELQKVQQYLVSQKFYIDYQCGNEQVWISDHRGETIEIDTDKSTVTVSYPFDTDKIFNTLEELKGELD
jgi:hypothetical protein